MATKHLVIIHGRAKKPECNEMERLVRTSLIAGLRRVNENAAIAVEQNTIKMTFVYYGDINNRILIKDDSNLKKKMVEVNGNWYVRPGSYDADLQHLLERPTDRHTEKDYEEWIQDAGLIRIYDDLARVMSPIFSIFGAEDRMIAKLLPDLGSYLLSRVVGSEIRERLQLPLKKILLEDEDIALLSHSMGCMVSYDVLWKFSRMSEYKELWDKKIKLWMTLGNPLGEPAVQRNLYDSNEPQDGRYPKNIINWININAKDDYVAHDGDVNDDFHLMLSRNLVQKIEDFPRIYTFWKDSDGTYNPHNFFAYLNHPTVADQLNKWIQDV
ncbi:hypothetical protein [Paenibacillus sp. OSY-SE]|uniref:hypothetical protein n=1 Tax=Paenibacillus sp. OSY-SE TaxID=1196323 RepID=UPI000319C5D6|nr:hypothetical protein [Paenibacillus sp. OSY-SE]